MAIAKRWKAFRVILILQIVLLAILWAGMVYILLANSMLRQATPQTVVILIAIAGYTFYGMNLFYNLYLLKNVIITPRAQPVSNIFTAILFVVFILVLLSFTWFSFTELRTLWLTGLKGIGAYKPPANILIAIYLLLITISGIYTVVMQLRLRRINRLNQEERMNTLIDVLGADPDRV